MLPAAVQGLRAQRSRSWRKFSGTPDEILWDFREGEYIPGGSKCNNIPNFFSEPHSGLSASVGMHRTLEQQGCPLWSTGPWLGRCELKMLNCSKSRIDRLRKRQVRWTSTGVAYCTASLTIIADFKSTHRLLLAGILFFFFLCLKIMKSTDQGKYPRCFCKTWSHR